MFPRDASNRGFYLNYTSAARDFLESGIFVDRLDFIQFSFAAVAKRVRRRTSRTVRRRNHRCIGNCISPVHDSFTTRKFATASQSYARRKNERDFVTKKKNRKKKESYLTARGNCSSSSNS